MGDHMSDFNTHNTTCASCESRINPHDSDSIECCETCEAYYCAECFNGNSETVCGGCIEILETAAPVNAYQQAMESLSACNYALTNVNDLHTLIIIDKVNGAIQFEDFSSDFFTLMQYFYKWERGNHGND